MNNHKRYTMKEWKELIREMRAAEAPTNKTTATKRPTPFDQDNKKANPVYRINILED